MKLAHSRPMAGHLGKRKTQQRVMQRFYWPGVRTDIAKFCSSCMECQHTARRHKQRAKLRPLPVIGESFRRIAKDIVGPLPRSKRQQIPADPHGLLQQVP